MTIAKTDLQKGLAALKAAANAGNPQARKLELLQKAQEGALSDDESEELVKSLNGGDLPSRATEGLATPEMKKSVDVSNFLREFTSGTQDGLRTLAEHIQKSQVDDHGFRIALATTLTSLGTTVNEQATLIKSLSEKIDSFGSLPARGPKSKGVTVEPVAKSFAGQPAAEAGTGQQEQPAEDKMSKAEVLDLIDEMHMQKGIKRIGNMDALMVSGAVEGDRAITDQALSAIAQYRKAKMKSAG